MSSIFLTIVRIYINMEYRNKFKDNLKELRLEKNWVK